METIISVTCCNEPICYRCQVYRSLMHAILAISILERYVCYGIMYYALAVLEFQFLVGLLPSPYLGCECGIKWGIILSYVRFDINRSIFSKTIFTFIFSFTRLNFIF